MRQKSIIIFSIVLTALLVLLVSFIRNQSEKTINSISLFDTRHQKIISLGMNLKEIKSILENPVDTIKTSDHILVLEYGDQHKGKIKIGFKDKKAVVFKLDYLSYTRFKTNKNVVIGTSNVDFWKAYNIPDNMSYHDKTDVRGSYVFKISGKNKQYNTILLNDEILQKNKNKNLPKNIYYLQILIDYKNFSNSISGILICTSEIFQDNQRFLF